MTAPVVVVRIGAEGGSIALIAKRTGESSWRFRRLLVDQTATFLAADEARPEIRHASEWVETWPEALALLDRYPWPSLFVLQVAPEFAERILVAVTERIAKETNGRATDRIERWREFCNLEKARYSSSPD